MRVAEIAPLYEPVPPDTYGGTERVVSYLTEALIDLGHEVTLFASADSQTRARLVASRDQSIRLDPAPLKSDLAAHLNMLYEVRRRINEFDVLHFHLDLIHFPMFEEVARRTLTTIHGRLDIKDLSDAYDRWHRYPLVSISDDQRRPLARANWAATVPHGIPLDFCRYKDRRDFGYLAFLGRVSPEKRPDRAIEVALSTGLPLKIAAKIDPIDERYFKEFVEPHTSGNAQIEFVGEVGETAKSEFLGSAAALLFPVDWPEPFGLVMIEAMACGTPVIAWNCGSVPEIVEEGVTGFVVSSIEEAVGAVRRLESIDRPRVRRRFEARFSSQTMAERYAALFGDLSG